MPEDLDPVLQVTGTRYATGTKGDVPFTRYEVAKGVFLTLFDDGRTKVRVDPVRGQVVRSRVHWSYPASVIVERAPLGSELDEDTP